MPKSVRVNISFNAVDRMVMWDHIAANGEKLFFSNYGLYMDVTPSSLGRKASLVTNSHGMNENPTTTLRVWPKSDGWYTTIRRRDVVAYTKYIKEAREKIDIAIATMIEEEQSNSY